MWFKKTTCGRKKSELLQKKSFFIKEKFSFQKKHEHDFQKEKLRASKEKSFLKTGNVLKKEGFN